MKTALIFPAGMPESLEELTVLQDRGYHVVGASSLNNDPARALYSHWAFLPFITDVKFEAAFLALLRRHSFSLIFTRHPIISRYLKALLEKHTLNISLDTLGFAAPRIAKNRSLFARVDAAIAAPFQLDIAGEAPALSRLAQASLLHHALQIEGQSSDEKIIALMEIFRSCPRGDIVEIGSFWGRSACVLALLASHFHVGSLLCIDPWENAAAHQEGVPSHLNEEAQAIDFNSAFQGFLINLMPYNRNHINYLRANSHSAHAAYTPPMIITSEAFGLTYYARKIACLHIDGNHDLHHITRDIEDWVPHVLPQGWIIVDDYQWPFGNAPQIVADLWMQKNIPRIARAFVTGSALFIQLAASQTTEP